MVDFQKLLKEKPVELILLQKLHDMGFKLVPLGHDGMPSMRWSDIYDNGWPSFHDIQKAQSKFTGVGTCFGYNPAKKLYLNCLDVDSENVFNALRDMDNPMVPDGDKRSVLLMAADYTYMVQTRKEFGLHVYWFSDKENPPITAQMCRPGCEFEIKTNKAGGMTTLPPSTHRSDKTFRYYNFGENTIAVNSKLYDILIAELKRFLKTKIEKPTITTTKYRQGQRTNEEWNAAFAKVQEWEISTEDAEALLAIIEPIYESGSRNQVMMGLAGMFRKFNVSQDNAEGVMKWLLDELKDGEWQGRMWNLKNTYKRDRQIDRIAGYGLIKDTNEYAAKAIMKLLLKSSHLFDDEGTDDGVSMPPV